ncbi:MAG TPA: HAMP domain-containing sensor histidine kinase [Pirellulaceae bacterium]|nr:HAMP domain-containing sensor histidine kinase [Pirellulaceae bacterium]
MFLRRGTLGWPITLGVVMIVALVALIVGWVLLTVSGAILIENSAGFYWTFLSVGSIVLILVLVGTVMYLSLSIKTINLNRRQSNFIDSVTHELKSPIASLKLYLQTLHRHQMSAEEQQGFFRDMLEDVERLDQLINHLLDAARLEKQPLESDIEEIELASLLADCAKLVCGRYRVPLETVGIDAQPCLVKGQRVDVEMIFRNLIDNAIKYGGTPPRVEITLRLEQNCKAVARIADNGEGIPLPQRRKIFGRFERLGLELERAKPGTGLGLYLVRTLAARLRGRVRIRDREAGSGTIFEVTLPAEPCRAASAFSSLEASHP